MCICTRKCFVILGIFLINFPNGMTWYYGNLSSYATSSLRFYLGPSVDVETVWLMSVFLAAWTAGLMLGALLQKLLANAWLVALIGVLLFDGAFAASAWTIQRALPLYICSLGALTGLADGVLCSACMTLIAMWASDKPGLATALATSSLGFGALVINQIISRYINPNNLTAETPDGNLTVFSQEEVVTQVPRVFLVLAVFNSIFHAVGLALIREKPRDQDQMSDQDSRTESCQKPVKGQTNSGFKQIESVEVEVLRAGLKIESEPSCAEKTSSESNDFKSQTEQSTRKMVKSDERQGIIPLNKQHSNFAHTTKREDVKHHNVYFGSSQEYQWVKWSEVSERSELQPDSSSVGPFLSGSTIAVAGSFSGMSFPRMRTASESRTVRQTGPTYGSRDECVVRPVVSKSLIHGTSSLTVAQTSYHEHCHSDDVQQNNTNGEIYNVRNGHHTKSYTLSIENGDSANGTKSRHCKKHTEQTGLNAAKSRDLSLEREYEGTSLTPLQMVCTRKFFVLWMAEFCMDYTLSVLTNYYKLFGELYIQDDHFLALIGTIMTASMIIPKLTWGMLLDRLGVKMTLVTMASATTILVSFWFYSAQLNRWIYSITTLGMCWCVCGFDSLAAAAVLVAFGPAHYTVNYGLVASASILLNLTSPVAMQLILDHLGWAWLFLSVSVVNTLLVFETLWCIQL